MSCPVSRFVVPVVLVLGSMASTAAQSRPQPCARPTPKRFADGEIVRLAQREYPCKLEMVETGLVLKSNLEGTIPDAGENIVMDSKGRIYSTTSTAGTLAVWKPNGTFERTFGRAGKGPQEFSTENFMLFLDGQDRLHVLSGIRTWSVLTPALEWVSRVERMEIGVDDDHTIVMPNGTVVGSIPQDTWFSTADIRGNVISRFGDYRTLGVNSRIPDDHVRSMSNAGPDRFWTIPERNSKDGYALELWGLDGKRHLTIKREVPWFPDGTGLPIPWNHRPPPYVFRVHADTTGLLFAVSVVVNENWDRLATARDREERRRIADQTYTIYLEAFDTRAGVVLASERHEGNSSRLFTRFMPGRLMGYRHVDTPEGLREARFFDIKLIRK